MLPSTTRVAIVGLGYVGLPLAVALARHFDCIGFDVDEARVEELSAGHDRTNEIDPERLKASTLTVTSSIGDVGACDFYIITVPTPIDENRDPDLTILKAASQTVGQMIGAASQADKRPVIIYESTVFPGATTEICAPIIERESGGVWKEDFFLGYSPERINPGDREHTIEKITKVVSGDTPETLDTVASLYDVVTSGGVFKCPSIEVAEAAKVIENAQRDVNIAFINEITQIFNRLDISIWDVLEAAKTKWNFLPFSPGLVGGHCIGVDPYYLAHRAKEVGMEAQVILSGRDVNDGMARWIARAVSADFGDRVKTALVLGLTFKENVPDLRNSKVADLVRELADTGMSITVHDPLADKLEASQEYGIELADDALDRKYDLVLLAVPHREYIDMGIEFFRNRLNEGGVVADLKAGFDGLADWNL